MNKRHQETILVKTGIYRYLVLPVMVTPVIAVACYPLIHNLKIYPIHLYQLKGCFTGMFR